MFPLLGALAGGLVSGLGSSLFNRMSQSYGVDLAKDMGSYNSDLQLNTLAHSGNAQRQADKALGRSSAFAQNGISVPASSTPSPSAMPANMDSLANNISALSQMQVNKQTVNTGKAQENLLGEQANTEIKKQQEIDANIESLRANANKANKEADKIVLDYEAQKILNKYLDEQKSAEIRNLNMNSEKIDKELKIAFKKLPYEIKEIAAATYAAKAKGNLDSKTIELVSANIRNVDQQTENLKRTWFNLKAEYRNLLIKNGYDFEKLLDCRTEAQIKILEKILLEKKIPHEEVNTIRDAIGAYNDAVNPLLNALGSVK